MGRIMSRIMSRIIELRLVHAGWKVFEGPGVEPVFPGPGGKESALSYAGYLDLKKLLTLQNSRSTANRH
jgi:hypothetical protein